MARKTFEQRVDEYRAFRAEHGRDPSQKSSDPAEKSLAMWLSDQRQADRKGELSPERATMLDDVNPGWRHHNGASPEQVWAERLAEYAAFRTEHGRDPSQKSSDPAEKSLAMWLKSQRQADRKGTLSPERVAMLSEVNSAWRHQNGVDPEQAWAERLAEYASFRTEHGRDPSKMSSDPAEKSLAMWLSDQRKVERKGQMSPERATMLDDVNPGWRHHNGASPEQVWAERLAEYAAFRTEHGRDPSKMSSDPAEKSLAMWLQHQRKADRKGTLSPERAAMLDEVNPGWRHTDRRFTRGRIADIVRDMVVAYSTMSEAELIVVAQQAGASPKLAALIAQRASAISHAGLLGSDLDARIEHDAADLEGEADRLDQEGDTEDEVFAAGEGTRESDEGALPDNEQYSGGEDDDETGGSRSVLQADDAAKSVWESARAAAFAAGDAEVVEFLINKAVARLWSVAYAEKPEDQDAKAREVLAKVRADMRRPENLADGDEVNRYYEAIYKRAKVEMEAALSVKVPAGYVKGSFIGSPLIMQRHVATRLLRERRIGNWSGTGAGKTISAILAARLAGAGRKGIVLVVCPNNVIDTWEEELRSTYPDHQVEKKTLDPTWQGRGPRWLLLNFELLAGRYRDDLKTLLESHRVDMLVVDEVHYAKDRRDDSRTRSQAQREASQRRTTLLGLRNDITDLNPDALVLAMSATPVVNNLAEAASLLEVVEGCRLADVKVRPTVQNAIAMHGHMTRLGVRYKPPYPMKKVEKRPKIAADHLHDVLTETMATDIPTIEKLLIEPKLDTIVTEALAGRAAGKRTLVYCHLLDGIVDPIRRALEDAGLRVGEYSGRDKTGRDRLRGVLTIDGQEVPVSEARQVDVLIGSPAISTGVNGLQHVVDRVVFAVLPWTNAEYEQIVGRILRTGQTADEVRVVVPMTEVTYSHGTFSWEALRMARIENKRDLAQAVIDGVVPDSHTPDRAQFKQNAEDWLRRVRGGDVVTTPSRPGLEETLLDGATPVPVPTGDDLERRRQVRAAGGLTKLNSAWCRASSQTLHKRLTRDRSEWDEYHEHYTKARELWPIAPAEVFAARLSDPKRYGDEPKVVADLGCGQRLLARSLTSQVHTLHEFDHVAYDENVTVADIANLPLEDRSIDIAVLSLALMGSNHMEYIAEAYRVLRMGGELWIAEPASKIGTDKPRVSAALEDYGFGGVDLDKEGQFAYIYASKRRAPASSTAPLLLTGDEHPAAAA